VRQVKKMGPFENLLEMLPGAATSAGPLKGNSFGRRPDGLSRCKRTEAIIQSMTPQERRNPKVLNGSRRKRIARGSGTSPADINDLMRRFDQAREMTRRLGKMQKSLKSRR
jgi:signal recognition particle subunit SRP54